MGIGAAMKRRWLTKGKEGTLVEGGGEGKGQDDTRELLKALAEGRDIPNVRDPPHHVSVRNFSSD